MRAYTLVLCALLASACVTTPRGPDRPQMTVAQVTPLVPPHVKDREGWATDVLAALEAGQFPEDPDTVCQVLAIIEQESNFQENPAVPGLPRMIKAELEKRVEKLGPLGPPALKELLSGKAPGTKLTFEQRLDVLKTERDLDVLFRDILEHYRERFPAPLKAMDLLGVLFNTSVEDFNPVTTVGSMQVSVEFAQKLAAKEKREVEAVRDELYTRPGGVLYGTARLLGFEAAYTQPQFRFADYNAGVYASRNAALQEQVGALIKTELVLDGDLLAYDKHGEPLDKETNSSRAVTTFAERFAPELTPRRIRRDLEEEKTARFESTETWRAIKRVYAQRMKADPPYARVPEVTLKSPKLTSDRSTAWFAKNVGLRYERCLSRGR